MNPGKPATTSLIHCCHLAKSSLRSGRTRVCVMTVTGLVVAGALAGAEGHETTGHPFSSERPPAGVDASRSPPGLPPALFWTALALLHDSLEGDDQGSL